MNASEAYSEKGFWQKLGVVFNSAGREVCNKALLLYFALSEPTTPAWAKATIVGALGYLIMPVDAVPDVIPVIGYADDLGVMIGALTTVSAYVTEEVERKAERALAVWFKRA